MMHRLSFDPKALLHVTLVGVGGSGSQMLSLLLHLHQALTHLGGQGLHLTAFDPDDVSKSNTVRQRYYPADIGRNKAITLIERVNLSAQTRWLAHPRRLRPADLASQQDVHLLITCVDTRQARREISAMLQESRVHYWLDLGNEASTAQVLLSQPSCRVHRSVAQPRLKTPLETHRRFLKGEDDDRPSCSALEALTRQDLYVNTKVATEAADLIWQLLRHGETSRVGAYINLQTGVTVPVPAPPPHKGRHYPTSLPPALISAATLAQALN